jgi:3-oxoisoapionate decarboxylase
MVGILREKDPEMLFDLEMITREPLKIPIFTDKYWVTFQEMPARQLAHMVEIVAKNPPKKPLPKVAGLSPADQVSYENECNLACLRYARQNLGV